MKLRSLLTRLFARGQSEAIPKFEDYRIRTGQTKVDHVPFACLEEFFSLTAFGQTPDEALRNLRDMFETRVKVMRDHGDPIPPPGGRKTGARFAAHEEIEALRPLVDEFWSEMLGTSYATLFVSNESRLSSWEHYLSGGRTELIEKVQGKYGVDISAFYDEPIPVVLGRIRDAQT